MNLAAFRISFPTFAAVGDTRASQALVDAAKRCNAEVFGSRYDAAVGLLAAHLIQTDPGGQNSRLDSDKSTSTYGREWTEIAKACTTMIRTF